jgi:hypothetical protein
LIAPQSANFVSIKDPTIVRYNDLYHVFATAYDTSRKAWSAVYTNFGDFSEAASAVQVPLAAKYSTNSDIANPDGWSAPKPLLSGGPSNGIDYWVICDSANCHLFFSGDDGKLYRSKTPSATSPTFPAMKW